MKLARRTLLAAAPFIAAPFPARAQTLSHGAFTHGVASGDPLPDAVMLWTRFQHDNDGRIAWEISEDESFAQISARGEAAASPVDDFCVHADARGLQPGRRYFYRFLSASGPSITGQTRTAPQGETQSLKAALFSCANFGFGYFHAYADAAADESIDLVLHCGDYIYELPRGSYPDDDELVPGRVIEPAGQTFTLSEYHQRYALYHTDPDLLELRRLKPICTVWDDHEFLDNAWKDGAPTHSTRRAPYAQRVADAAKAYFDWMPIRRPDQGLRLYRALDWGDLARIVLMDSRLTGRDQQLTYTTGLVLRFMTGGADNALAEFRARLDNPARSMLGAAQEAWLTQTLAESKARGQTWQILTQQVVVGDQIAAPGLGNLVPEDAPASTRRYIGAGARISALGLPWNLDSWNGYPAARARLLETCAANSNNSILLGGDSHNCWLNNLAAPGSERLAAIEFAGGSVTSPGFERPLSLGAPGEREQLMRASNPALSWCDATNRGYGVLTFTRAGCAAEWRAVSDVSQRERGRTITTHLDSAASTNAGPGAWTLT